MARSYLVTFDLGGVLVRVAQQWHQAIAKCGLAHCKEEALQSRLSSAPGFDAYQAARITEDEYLDDLMGYLGLGSREEALLAHNSILLEPYPGTPEMVETLHAMGIDTACLSNTNAPHWVEMGDLSKYPAIASLKRPVLSHVIRAEKPHPEIYRIFEEQTGYEADQIIFFDDLLDNVEGAKRAGWNAFRIDPSLDTPPQIWDHLAKFGIVQPSQVK
ncbi:MAG: HAD-IA family hydrolase [Armatimonadetes bacterium]|nr:HAD-IA family hydrolase [Armatimonadota bacterium]